MALDHRAISQNDSDIARFIKRVRASPHARFILTTRAYILEEARHVSEHLADHRLDVTKYVLVRRRRYTSNQGENSLQPSFGGECRAYAYRGTHQLRVKIRDDAIVRNKAVYLALAVLPDGSRGVDDILIAVVDGLKGLSDAIETAFPRTTVQTCLVHLIRNSLAYASWKDLKAVAAALRPIYTAATAEAAAEALEEFCPDALGRKASDDRAILKASLAERHPVLCVCS